jgi:hypothetical protein
MIPIIVMIAQKAAIRAPAHGVSISFALAIHIIPVTQTTIVPSHIVIVILNHNAIINNPKRTISINAVCFAILARAKKTPEIIIYLLAILSSSLIL